MGVSPSPPPRLLLLSLLFGGGAFSLSLPIVGGAAFLICSLFWVGVTSTNR